MNKAIIAFAALPLAFGTAGYAAGQFLPALTEVRPSEETEVAAPSEHAVPTLDEAFEGLSDEGKNAVDAHDASAHGTSEDDRASQLTDTAEKFNDSSVVRLGRISVPVYRADSVTYVVSEVGVKMSDVQAAVDHNDPENISRLRDAVLSSMHKAASSSSMNGATVDAPALSKQLAGDLRDGFGNNVADVLFLSLVQANVPRI